MKFSLSPRRIARPLSAFKSRRSPSQPASAQATPPASKLKTVLLRIRPRGATVLSTIKVTATVVGQLGSVAPAPMIQPIADGVKKIVEHCETVRMHKEECVELRDLVLKYVNALERLTEGVSGDKMDAQLAYSLAELDDELVKISSTMEKLSRKSFIRRIISTGESAELLTKHRRVLQDAVDLFQTSQVVRTQIEFRALKASVSSEAGADPGAPFFLKQRSPYDGPEIRGVPGYLWKFENSDTG